MLTYLSNNLPPVSIPDSHYVAICTSVAKPIAAVHIHGQLCAVEPCPSLHASTEKHAQYIAYGETTPVQLIICKIFLTMNMTT